MLGRFFPPLVVKNTLLLVGVSPKGRAYNSSFKFPCSMDQRLDVKLMTRLGQLDIRQIGGHVSNNLSWGKATGGKRRRYRNSSV